MRLFETFGDEMLQSKLSATAWIEPELWSRKTESVLSLFPSKAADVRKSLISSYEHTIPKSYECSMSFFFSLVRQGQ